MKATHLAATLAVLSFSTLLAAGSAQACGGRSSASVGSCATAQTQIQSPTQSQSSQQSCPNAAQAGKSEQSCGLINPELLSAAGEAATNGMKLAATVMRGLAGEVNRLTAPAAEF